MKLSLVHLRGDCVYGSLRAILPSFLFCCSWMLFLPTSARAQELFTDMSASLEGVTSSSVAWGDYDNDGDLDILLMGINSDGTPISRIYRNDAGVFSYVPTSLIGVFEACVAWGDYDNDGDLDILLAGHTGANPVTKIYRNDGGGVFSDISASLDQAGTGSVAWGDYDNDGDLDILLTGTTGATVVSKVYRNDGGGVFSDIFASLAGVGAGSAAWGDYDNDGDLDILLTGISSSGRISKVYRNDGGGIFSDILAPLAGVQEASAAWGDFDSDGDLDILLSGLESPGSRITKIYRNDGGGVFTDIAAPLDGVYRSSVAWGDYDNDGDLDILLTGNTGISYVSKVYRNDGSIFSDVPTTLTPVTGGCVAWGDYDNDGDLDILLTGSTGSGLIAKIYRNNGTVVNTVPGAPSTLSASILGTDATMSWNAATDGQTPSNGLTYNLRVGTTPGASNVLGPMASTANGYRRVPKIGPANLNRSFTLKGLTGEQTYYWSVQAIDNAFAGGAFAEEGTFTISGYTLTVHAPNGTVTKNPDQFTYAYGTVVSLTPDPASGYHFVKWTGDIPSGHETDNPLSITMDANKVITANFGQGVFDDIGAALIGVEFGSVAWGDYDSDGDQDILLTGYSGGAYLSTVFRNNAGTFTQQSSISLTGVVSGTAAWGDYDNDGDLDILVTGRTYTEIISKVYRNNGDNTFTEQTSISLTGIAYGSVAWGDYDNDGDLDILLTGIPGEGFLSKIYRNNGNGTFTEQTSISLEGVGYSSVGWGDYDNDGYLDILLTGHTGGYQPASTIYHNNGDNTFTAQTSISLARVTASSVAWGDYDNDGDLDILLTGDTGPGYVSKIYRNDNDNTFTEQTSISLTGIQGGSAVWGDYDNDGYLDILLAGNGISKVYRNNGDNTFTEQTSITLTGVSYCSAAWGDYDNDGDLDILLAGDTGSGYVSKVYRNNNTITNTTPSAPVSLSCVVTGTDVALSWGAATDTQTPQNGLTYNLRVGTAPGASNILGPMANTVNGYRRVPKIGPVNLNRSFTLKGLVPGQSYYWSVQAIDNALAGGAFADEATFTMSGYTLTVNATNGTVTKDPDQPTYPHGTVVSLTPNPSSGYQFVNWTGDVPSGHETDNPLSITMDGNKSITANFSAVSATWVSQTIPLSSTLRSVHFVDASTGWAAGYDGVILHTTDGGGSWSQQASGISDRLLAIRFVDAIVGWAVAGIRVLRTTNGGANWINNTGVTIPLVFRNSIFPVSSTVAWVPANSSGVPTATRWFYRYTVNGPGSLTEEAFNVIASGVNMLDISFTDADNGWSVGTSGQIWKISNASGGSPSFTNQTNTGVTTNTLRGIYMLDANNGWIAGEGGTILRTTNGGSNWSTVTSGTTTNLRDIHFVDSNHGCVVGDNGLIRVTTDGGSTWSTQTSGVSTTLWSVIFVDASPGYACGGDFTTSSNGVIVTTDQVLPIQLASFTAIVVGLNHVRLEWTTLTEVNNYGFEVQRSADSTSRFATIPNSFVPGHGTTNEPQHYSYIDSAATPGVWYYRLKQMDLDGAIHYSEGIRVSILTHVKEEEIPTVFSLSQNYPNPFNPSTTFHYGLPHTSFVTLIIYNTLGQQVAQLVNEQQQAGFHDVMFRGDGLASGMYLYRLQAGDFVASKKLLLLK